MSPDKIYLIVSAIFAIVIGYDVINWFRDRSIMKPEIRLQRLRSKINFTALVLGVTFLFASVLLHINFLRYSSPIEHEHASSITLRDFKGYKVPYETVDGIESFAFITTTISWWKNGNEVDVKALFHPSRSYVFNANTFSKFLLQHELYHFHLQEVFARRCRKKLSEYKATPSRAEIADVITTYRELENDMQRLYDEQTYHSYVLKEQKRWESEIDSLLTSLEQYRDTRIIYSK